MRRLRRIKILADAWPSLFRQRDDRKLFEAGADVFSHQHEPHPA